jgi:hypothetical protein
MKKLIAIIVATIFVTSQLNSQVYTNKVVGAKNQT